MKVCAYCGSENRDDAHECQLCGTDFVIPKSPELVSPAIELHQAELLALESSKPESPMPELPEVEPDVLPDEEAMLCTNCVFPNLPRANWCKRCGAPLGWAAPLVFPEAAIATGYVFRNAVARPNTTALVGIWVLCTWGIFFSFLLLWLLFTGGLRNNGNFIAGNLWLYLLSRDGWSDMNGLYVFWRILLSLTIAFTLLFRTTRNYLRTSKRTLDQAES